VGAAVVGFDEGLAVGAAVVGFDKTKPVRPPFADDSDTADKSTDQPSNLSADKPTDQTSDLSVDKPTDQTSDLSANKPTDQTSDLSATKPTDQPSNLSDSVFNDAENDSDAPVAADLGLGFDEGLAVGELVGFDEELSVGESVGFDLGTEFDEDSCSETEFDVDSSSETEIDVDAVDFDGNDTNVYFIVKPFDDAAKKAELILNETNARMKKQDKGPTTESEKAYLVTAKSKFAELFKLGYDLISAKCKRDDLGRHVYEPKPMVGPASKSVGCYKVVQVTGGNNKGRVKTG
jgi:hypothetical protein